MGELQLNQVSHIYLTHREIVVNKGGTAGVPLVPMYVGREDFLLNQESVNRYENKIALPRK